jgi:hypothetical protein
LAGSGDIEGRLDALETEVERLRDELAIYRLIASYGPLVDAADSDERRSAAASMFGADGEYDLGREQRYTGSTQIAALLARDTHAELLRDGCAHVMGLPHVTVRGDRADALSYSRVYRHEAGRFFVWRVAANHWSLAKKAGTWSVVRRVNRLLDGSEEARALLHRVSDG